MAMTAIRNMAAPLLFSDTDAEDGQLQQQGHNLRCCCMSTIGTPNASPDMLGLNELARLLMFNLHYACQGCSKGMLRADWTRSLSLGRQGLRESGWHEVQHDDVC